MNKKSSNIPPIFYILLALIGIFGWSKFQAAFSQKQSHFTEQVETKGLDASNYKSSLDKRFSLGEKILIRANATNAKQKGIDNYRQGKYSLATNYFRQSLNQYPNDPETRIYLNNSLVTKQQPVKIAVVVPIGSNLDVAQEMLRGVAQAQFEFNEQIGKKLQVQIVNDENDSNLAKKVAQVMVKDESILAVVGSNASNASIAGAKVYQRAGLVMITPTSTSDKLSNFGEYIFRAAPTNQKMADTLAEYVLKTAKRQSVAICYDSQAPDNTTFKDAFISALEAKDGNYIETKCDFADPAFNAENSVTELISNGAEAVLLAPHIDKLNRPIDFARANQWKMMLLGTFSLNTTKITQTGQGDLNGVILPVPFHEEQDSAKDFSVRAKKIWGKDTILTWRTGTSYDATKAISATLNKAQNRQQIQSQIKQDGFFFSGANGTGKFLKSGDRSFETTLVSVKANPERGYYFELIKDKR